MPVPSLNKVLPKGSKARIKAEVRAGADSVASEGVTGN